MNPLLPIMAGTVPVAAVVLAFFIRLNRDERRRDHVSKQVTDTLRDTIQRGVCRESNSRLRPKLVFERTATTYRGYIPKLEPSQRP